jgi:hypothetical protein
MKSGGCAVAAASTASWLVPALISGVGTLAGLGASLSQDVPEPAKPGLPGAAPASPVGSSAPPANSAFMGRQNTSPEQRQSTALALLK